MPPPPSIITIGTFDGAHRGHAALLSRAAELRARIDPSARILALAFHPHPLSILRPEAAPALLTTFQQREALIRAAGADEVIRLDPTPELLAQTPEAFIRSLVSAHHPVAFIEGPDFRFGRARAGDLSTLRQLGQAHGFSVHIVDPVTVSLTDCTIVTASSTITRWLLCNARVRDAARVLGHPYELTGTVTQGDRRGRTIGFPTANLATDQLIPADGVYAAVAILPDGRTFPAAVSIGTKPTFGPHPRAVEAHLLDAASTPPLPPRTVSPPHGLAVSGRPSHSNLPEYGWPLRLQLHAWIRDQLKLESLESLINQMHRDCDRIRTMLSASDPILPDPNSPELAACR